MQKFRRFESVEHTLIVKYLQKKLEDKNLHWFSNFKSFKESDSTYYKFIIPYLSFCQIFSKIPAFIYSRYQFHFFLEKKPTCPPGEVFYQCLPTCRTTCETLNTSSELCTTECQPGCFCQPGFLRNDKGVCVRPVECVTRKLWPNKSF